VSERDLDIVLDHLGTLNDLTPKLRCEGKSGVPPNLIFGLDSKQFLDPGPVDKHHHSEVETLTLTRGIPPTDSPTDSLPPLSRQVLAEALDALPKDSVYRVKGFLSFPDTNTLTVLNWAFGRSELVPLTLTPRNPMIEHMKPGDALLTVMGAAGELAPHARKLSHALGARLV
jgi:hypothetical protein